MEYRMYVLVLKQLSGIDKGIQAAHACLEYALKYGETNDYKNYINNSYPKRQARTVKFSKNLIRYKNALFCKLHCKNKEGICSKRQ